MQRRHKRQRRTLHPLNTFEFLEARRVLDGTLSISEIVANNDGSLLDQNGQASDWIEISNADSSAVALQGMYLTDDPDDLTKWRFPDVQLDAGSHLVIFASGNDLQDSAQSLHSNFKLNDDGEYVALVAQDGRSIIDELTFDRQVEGLSFGTGQESKTTTLLATGANAHYFIPDDGSLALDWTKPDFNDAQWSTGATSIGFGSVQRASAIAYANRLGSRGTQTFGGALGMDFEVQSTITVTDLGVFDSDADGLSRTLTAQLWSRRGDTGTLLVEQRFTRQDPGELIQSDRLKSLSEPLELTPGDYTIVAYGYGDGEPNGNSGTGGPNEEQKSVDDGEGALSFVGGSRYGTTAGAFPRIVDGGPENRYSAGTFRYTVVASGNGVETDLESEMHGRNSSVYLRIPFDMMDVDSFDRLHMHINYDDGFAAYLNGNQIAQRNAPDELTWSSTATVTRPENELAPLTIDVSSHANALRNGQNVLAIHGLNISPHDDDFLIDVELESVDEIGELKLGYFANPTPGKMNSQIDFVGLVSEPTFSQERGFISNNFDLAIEAHPNDATIAFTLDGSEPSFDANGAILRGAKYNGPLSISDTTTIRAMAWKSNFLPSQSTTHTYLFLDQVVNQTNEPANYPSTWRGAKADYGMSQNVDDLPIIAGNAAFSVAQSKEVIKESLLAIPTMSIVMDQGDLFDSRNGIYANPSRRGDAWERATSVEYLLPNGDPGFQSNAGIQIMGGTSRDLGRNIKQSFRLVFKEEYGAERLNYPFFPENSVSTFNTLALRTNSRDNWTSRQYTNSATYLRDEWAKRTHSATGQLATSGQFVHLYINGMYWGIYNPTERPDAAFVASHSSAKEDDIDTVKFCCPQRVVDGDWDKWNELRSLVALGLNNGARYQRIQGNNPDGTRNPQFEVLIDVDNLIDYVIHGQFTGSEDWPGNYYVARDRSSNSEGFQFFTWDNDLAFRRNDKVTTDPRHNWWTESPGEMDVALRENAEYRIRFADRVRQLYFNDGPLTSEAAANRWIDLTDELRLPLIAESARWGDYRRDVAPAGPRTLYTPHDQWAATVDSVANYLESRNAQVLSQLKSHELYPEVEAPLFSQYGGRIANGFQLDIDAVVGTVFAETILVDEGAPVSAWVPTSDLHDGNAGEVPPWTLAGFDDSSWIQGHGGVGYERGSGYEDLLGIDLLDSNLPALQRLDADGNGQNDNSSVYARFEFELDETFDPSKIDALLLRIHYDDGFVAYLNGTRALRVNAPTRPQWNSKGTAGHEADSQEEFDITRFVEALQPGQSNVLAIHGLNRSLNNSDFLISPQLLLGKAESIDQAPVYFSTNGADPRLVGGAINTVDALRYDAPITLTETTRVKARAIVDGEWSAMTEATFVVPNIVVSEIHFNPAPPTDTERNAGFIDNDDFEFVELANIGSSEIDLTGLQFIQVAIDGDQQGIDFDFSTGDITKLLPGDTILVVKQADAFALRYGHDLPVTGQFMGRLSNGGETITLQAFGETMQQFLYADEWHPATDGKGASLEIRDPTGNPTSWNQAGGWRPSRIIGGTPGRVDVIPPIPGDSNHDGVFNSADLVMVFIAGEYEDDIDGNSKFEDGDWNDDGDFNSADLVFAFQAGTFVASAVAVDELANAELMLTRKALAPYPRTLKWTANKTKKLNALERDKPQWLLEIDSREQFFLIFDQSLLLDADTTRSMIDSTPKIKPDFQDNGLA